mmetsp:Transcript_13948/g.44270  ORF Transcript_13948/g.44270 Transcript_13948/m.44270 type:complete len:142 (+) Transcript_13948:3158-3583(+)
MEAAAPGEGAGYLAPPVAAVEVQALFADSMATLSSLSASLAAPDGPGGAAGLLAASSGGAPADSSALLAEVGRVEMAADNSSRARAAAEEGGERSRLVAEVAQLRVELARGAPIRPPPAPHTQPNCPGSHAPPTRRPRRIP